jgi:hypothetical protein
MKSSQQLATTVSPDLRIDAPPREIQELWFALARTKWKSIALVPADQGGSTALLARQLANVPKWLREQPVILLTMSDPLDYVLATEIVVSTPGAAQEPAKARAERVIVSVQPVVVEPLGLGVTQSADVVVLCVEMGRTRMSAARRTIQLIGRERIAGCFIVN